MSIIGEYNTEREQIVLKEYGRNVQKLVNHIMSIADDDERTRKAHQVVKFMKQINTSYRENEDNHNKVWSDLYIISDYKLDVKDAPIEKPVRSIRERRPEPVPYTREENIRFKHYGRNIELLIKEACAKEDPKKKEEATIYVGKLMKRFYGAWNKENPDDMVILRHLREMSGGELDLDAERVKEEGLFNSQLREVPNYNNPRKKAPKKSSKKKHSK